MKIKLIKRQILDEREEKENERQTTKSLYRRADSTT